MSAGPWSNSGCATARSWWSSPTRAHPGSWILATSWGLALAGLLTAGLTASLFTLVCVATVVALFTLRGAAFGAERLAVSGTCESADVCGRATRSLSRVGLAGAGAATAAAPLPGGVVSTAPLVAIALALVVLVSLALTSGVTGPMLSRYTSAVAIAVPGVLVALVAELPTSSVPETTGLFVWSMLIPAIPVMFIGQVWLYRMTRRPATEPSFFTWVRPSSAPGQRTFHHFSAMEPPAAELRGETLPGWRTRGSGRSSFGKHARGGRPR